jgi:hypothetical protein
MKFKVQFVAPRIDVSSYRDALDMALKEAISQALMEWLDRVLEEIPEWSGASRATFSTLAETIGMVIPSVPTASAKVMVGNRVSEGLMSSAGSKLSLNEPPGQYTFTYQSNLPWLVWNEYNNANENPDPTKWPPPAKLLKPGPYDFQAKGLMTFIQFSKGVRLPVVGPFCIGKKIRV